MQFLKNQQIFKKICHLNILINMQLKKIIFIAI